MSDLKIKDVINAALDVGLTTQSVAEITKCSRQQVWLDRQGDSLVECTKTARREALYELHNQIAEARRLGFLPVSDAVVALNKSVGVDAVVRAQLQRVAGRTKKQEIV